MRIFTTLCLLLFLGLPEVTGQLNKQYNENELSNYIQTLIGGHREFSFDGGRVDLVLDSLAIEIEWAKNWQESIGQSLWYSLNTNRKPAIILLMNDESDYKYFLRLNSTLEYVGLNDDLKVFLFPHDFEKLIQNTRE